MADEHGEHKQHKKHSGGHGAGHGGGGHEEHEGAPEWLISFADNVALMMGFFVVLLAMNMKPAAAGGASGSEDASATGAPAAADEQMLDWAIEMRRAFHNPVDSENPKPTDLVLAKRMRERESQAVARVPGQKGIEREVRSIRHSDNFSQGGTVSFASGASEIGATGAEELAELIKHRKGLFRNVVEVRGHASAAEAFDLPDRGMRLSYERAWAVATALNAAGIGWNQIRLVSCADNDRKIQTSYDEVGHRENQRVEVIETDELLSDGTKSPAAKPSDLPGSTPAAPSGPPHE